MRKACFEVIARAWRRTSLAPALTFTFFLLLTLPSLAQECNSGSDLDPATKTALNNVAQQYFQMAASGNVAALQQNSIPAVANDFGGIQTAINDNKGNFGTSSTVIGTYELDAPGTTTYPRAEFYCGIFNSPERVGFVLNNLPPGRYALVIMRAEGGKQPITVSLVLQQDSSQQWKLAGFYARPTSLSGHDAQWYLTQARQYKAQGQNHNAWFYYLVAWDLTAPVPFMSTSQLDKITDEMQSIRPSDLPSPQQPLQLAAGTKTYSVTQLFAVPVENGLGLVVKYQVPDVSDTQKAFADNMAVIQALVTRYPEFRQAFSSVVARAVAPNGQDYGTLLAMKEVK